MKTSRLRKVSGFTLVEIMVSMGIISMVGGICYYILSAGTVLYAKNFSINASGSALRGGLDRINAEVSQATALPKLITLDSGGAFTVSSTSPSSGTAVGPAAGIVFDKYLGGPYILESTGTTTSSSFSMKRSTNALVIAPVPLAGDLVVVDGCPRTNRSIVGAAIAGSVSGGLQSITVTLASGNTTSVAWTSSDKKPVKLYRKVAFIVVGNELRFYPSMEDVTNYTTATYSVITKDIGTGTGEGTPFSLILKNGQFFLSMSFRAQNQDNNRVLANKESKEQTTSLRIDTLICPRNTI